MDSDEEAELETSANTRGPANDNVHAPKVCRAISEMSPDEVIRETAPGWRSAGHRD